jgi:hypothetical protein
VGGALLLPTGRLISWSEDGTLRVWDMEAALAGPYDEVARVTGHSADVTHTITLPGGHMVSCSEQDHTICVWDPATGTLLHALRGHADAALGILALPGERVLSWSKDATLRIWDAARGAQIEVLTGHTGYVWGARLLQDGRILSWSLDGTLRLWDGQHGTPIAVLVGHKGGSTASWSRVQDTTNNNKATASILLDMTGVQGATEFPDGRILSWGGDSTLKVWDPDGPGRINEVGSALMTAAPGMELFRNISVVGNYFTSSSRFLDLGLAEGIHIVDNVFSAMPGWGSPSDGALCVYGSTGFNSSATVLKNRCLNGSQPVPCGFCSNHERGGG